MMLRLITAMLTGLILAATLVAPAEARDKDRPKAEKVITVYLGAHTGRGIEREINDLHGRMEREGWRFAQMVPHVENSDTEGVWVTYVR
jgi:hypothetical protein